MAPGGFMLMGVRLYNATTGRFLSADLVDGGSCNDYEYVCANPVNSFDLNGRRMWTKFNCRFLYCTQHLKFNKKETAQIGFGSGALGSIIGVLNNLGAPGRIAAAILGTAAAYVGYLSTIGRCLHVGVFYTRGMWRKTAEYAWPGSYTGGYCKW
jgi:hypothetical protein